MAGLNGLPTIFLNRKPVTGTKSVPNALGNTCLQLTQRLPTMAQDDPKTHTNWPTNPIVGG